MSLICRKINTGAGYATSSRRSRSVKWMLCRLGPLWKKIATCFEPENLNCINKASEELVLRVMGGRIHRLVCLLNCHMAAHEYQWYSSPWESPGRGRRGEKRVLSVFRYEIPQIRSGSTELPPPPIQAIKNKYWDKKVCMNEMGFWIQTKAKNGVCLHVF